MKPTDRIYIRKRDDDHFIAFVTIVYTNDSGAIQLVHSALWTDADMCELAATGVRMPPWWSPKPVKESIDLDSYFGPDNENWQAA